MGRFSLILTAIATIFLSTLAPLRADEPLPVIKGIRVVRNGDTVGVEISADRNLEYTCYKMPQLQKVVIDLPMTEPGRPDTVYKVESSMISTIKLRKKMVNDVMLTRISVDLTGDADFTTQSDPSDRTKVTVFLRKPTSPTASGADLAPTPTVPHLPPATSLPSYAPTRTTQPGQATPTQEHLVSISRVTFGPDTVDIVADGNIGDFGTFTLHRPERLVIDLTAALTTLRSLTVPRNHFGIRQARIGTFDGKLRLVLETGEQPFPHHDVVRTDSGLRIVFHPATTGKNQATKGTK